MTTLEKQLLALSAMGISIFHADGHRHIECRTTYSGYNFHKELVKHGVLLNGKIYGGVKEAVSVINDCFIEMYGENIIEYYNWIFEDTEYSIEYISDTNNRSEVVDKGCGGLY